MTIKLTWNEFFTEQFQEATEEKQWDTSDERDMTYQFDARFSQGWRRNIQLREGLSLDIDRHQLTDRLLINGFEGEASTISCTFTLSGKGQGIIPSALGEALFPYLPLKYFLQSNGLGHQSIHNFLDIDFFSIINIDIHPSVLRSFATSLDGELPENLQHLIQPPSKDIYWRSGDTTPTMVTVLQQILQCPYQDMVKRIYLESKVTELIALVVAHEIAIQQGEDEKSTLKPEQLERIHYAKEILLRDLSNPPSLEQLAHQAGLNEFTLKHGFRQAFGTTVFGELRSHRLEIAKQLLAEQDITVTETAHRVGYACVRSFAKAFKHKFGLGPKAYQKACR
ncbi:MAG: helix-turn-helix domain-containing protein [Cyanobacteria bacterium P01_H01_bin.162]